jgi:hypothetical protein
MRTTRSTKRCRFSIGWSPPARSADVIHTKAMKTVSFMQRSRIHVAQLLFARRWCATPNRGLPHQSRIAWPKRRPATESPQLTKRV